MNTDEHSRIMNLVKILLVIHLRVFTTKQAEAGCTSGFLDRCGGLGGIPYNGYACFVPHFEKGTWIKSYKSCLFLFANVNADYIQMAAFANQTMYNTVINDLLLSYSDYSGTVWLGAKALSNVNELSSYYWMTDQNTPVILKATLTLDTDAVRPTCLYTRIISTGLALNLTGANCENRAEHRPLCEFGCYSATTPPSATKSTMTPSATTSPPLTTSITAKAATASPTIKSKTSTASITNFSLVTGRFTPTKTVPKVTDNKTDFALATATTPAAAESLSKFIGSITAATISSSSRLGLSQSIPLSFRSTMSTVSQSLKSIVSKTVSRSTPTTVSSVAMSFVVSTATVGKNNSPKPSSFSSLLLLTSKTGPTVSTVTKSSSSDNTYTNMQAESKTIYAKTLPITFQSASTTTVHTSAGTTLNDQPSSQRGSSVSTSLSFPSAPSFHISESNATTSTVPSSSSSIPASSLRVTRTDTTSSKQKSTTSNTFEIKAVSSKTAAFSQLTTAHTNTADVSSLQPPNPTPSQFSVTQSSMTRTLIRGNAGLSTATTAANRFSESMTSPESMQLSTVQRTATSTLAIETRTTNSATSSRGFTNATAFFLSDPTGSSNATITFALKTQLSPISTKNPSAEITTATSQPTAASSTTSNSASKSLGRIRKTKAQTSLTTAKTVQRGSILYSSITPLGQLTTPSHILSSVSAALQTVKADFSQITEISMFNPATSTNICCTGVDPSKYFTTSGVSFATDLSTKNLQTKMSAATFSDPAATTIDKFFSISASSSSSTLTPEAKPTLSQVTPQVQDTDASRAPIITSPKQTPAVSSTGIATEKASKLTSIINNVSSSLFSMQPLNVLTNQAESSLSATIASGSTAKNTLGTLSNVPYTTAPLPTESESTGDYYQIKASSAEIATTESNLMTISFFEPSMASVKAKATTVVPTTYVEPISLSTISALHTTSVALLLRKQSFILSGTVTASPEVPRQSTGTMRKTQSGKRMRKTGRAIGSRHFTKAHFIAKADPPSKAVLSAKQATITVSHPLEPSNSHLSKIIDKTNYQLTQDYSSFTNAFSTLTHGSIGLATSTETSLILSRTLQNTQYPVRKLAPSVLSPNATKTNKISKNQALFNRISFDIGCAWLISALTLSVLVAAIRRSKTFISTIQVNTDISLLLATIIVLAFAFRDDSKFNDKTCKIAALGLQYFYTVSFSFQLIESIYVYCVLTSVTVGHEVFVGLKKAIALCWGLPIVITTATAATSYNRLMSDFSCWINVKDDGVFLASFAPMLALAIPIAVLLESAGYEKLAFALPGNVVSCRIARWGLIKISAMQFAVWYMAAVAIYYQRVALFAVLFGMNITLGVFIFLYHLFSDQKVRTGLKNLFKKIQQKLK